MTEVELLKAARSRISDKARWTQWQYARDSANCVVRSDAPEAVCWCAQGALLAECGDGADSAYLRAIDALVVAMGTTVHKFNDTHTHEEVLAAFDRAIQIAEDDAKEVEANHE